MKTNRVTCNIHPLRITRYVETRCRTALDDRVECARSSVPRRASNRLRRASGPRALCCLSRGHLTQHLWRRGTLGTQCTTWTGHWPIPSRSQRPPPLEGAVRLYHRVSLSFPCTLLATAGNTNSVILTNLSLGNRLW